MSIIPAGYQYNDCRGMLRHAWHEVPSDWQHSPTPGSVPFTVRCERCDMERRDVLSANSGEVVTRRYVQPVGYHIDAEDEGLPNIYDFRLDWIKTQAKKARKR